MMYIYLFIYLLIGATLYSVINGIPEYQEGLYQMEQKYPQHSIKFYDICCFILLMLLWPMLLILAVKKL